MARQSHNDARGKSQKYTTYSTWGQCSDENKVIRVAKCDAYSGVCESIQ